MFGLTTTRRLRAELADARAETNRQRERAETAEGARATAEYNREQVLRQLAEAGAANRRLYDRNLELGRRLASASDPQYAARLERRVDRLRKATSRILAAYHGEQRRADHLQRRLDQALGLDAPAIEQGGARARHDRLNAPKETA
jgi:hypothetical protein